MKSKLHNLIDLLMEAIIPAIAAEKSYDTILAAFGCINARIAMAAPERPDLISKENAALHQLTQYSQNALAEFLKVEQERTAKEAILDKGIDGFAQLFDPEAKPSAEEIMAEQAEEERTNQEKEWPVQDQKES